VNENEINQNQYGVDQIEALDNRSSVRRRPGMYIGSTSSQGIGKLCEEIIDNSIDEFIMGFGDEIDINIYEDATVKIIDRGRGIPVGPHKKWVNEDGTSMDTLTGILTTLHAGGKFSNGGYATASGLHGVGSTCVNFLSDFFEVIVKREGKIYRQQFKIGIPQTKNPEIIGKCDLSDTGTQITYHPDKEIFKITLEPHCKDLQKRLNELASLNMGLKINYKNEISGVDREIYYPDGISGYVKRLIENENLLYDKPIYIKGSHTLPNEKIIIVEIAFIHIDNEQPSEIIKTFANNINTHEGGYHLQGFRNSYKKQLNKYGFDNKLIEEIIELKYLLDGICVVISIKIPDPEFDGQTKNKLGNLEAQTAIEDVMDKAFEQMFKNKEDKIVFETLIMRAMKVKEAEEVARKARALNRKAGKANRMALPGKLADCANKNGYSEIFVVEGDSAGGSAKNGRFREFQAILPLFGKLLNTEKATLDQMIDSEKIKIIIAALQAGVGSTFDINKVRYDKIIIMSDADVDGAHITALILTFFYKYMRPLIEDGRIHLACPPLYKITKGKQDIYIKDDQELREYKKKNGSNFTSVRFKGLGEMHFSQLKETVMNPETRMLKKVTIEDAEKAVQIFNIWMGNQPQLRRDFIEANANQVILD